MTSIGTVWALRSVEELCSRVTSGGTPSRSRADFYSPATIPWVKTGDLNDALVTHYDEYISEAGVRGSSAKLLPAGTVLMAMYGATVGKLGMLTEAATCNQASCAMIVAPETCDPRWLFYALLNDRDMIVSRANGAAQQNLSGTTIKNFQFPTPPLKEQRAIAEVLGALDDKIAANKVLVGTADQLSHSIFTSISRTSGQAVPLSGTAEFVNGKAFTKNASGTGRVVIRIAELNSGIGGSTVYNDIDVNEQHLARPGDLLFAWSGSLTLHRWFRPEGIVNQHIFKVIPKRGYPHWLVYELLRHKLEEFKSIAADKATTMGHIQRKHLDEPVAAPSTDEISKHHELMAGLWDHALAAEIESLRLTATRDALLPQLMSGKLRVKDAEKVLEGAGV